MGKRARLGRSPGLHVVAVLVAVVAAACVGPPDASQKVSDGPLVGPEAGGGMGMANTVSEPNVSYAVDGLGFCTEVEDVELLRVAPVKTIGSLELERFGVRAMTPGRQMLEEGKPLPADFVSIEGFRKVTSCAANEWTEVGVQLRRTGPGEARVEHFTVEYRQGDKSYREQWPVTITLCDPASEQRSEDCETE